MRASENRYNRTEVVRCCFEKEHVKLNYELLNPRGDIVDMGGNKHKPYGILSFVRPYGVTVPLYLRVDPQNYIHTEHVAM